jgi:hypothetical protein
MTDELPPIWALDKAAKAAGYSEWLWANDSMNSPVAQQSIIAHARTIAQYEQSPVDPLWRAAMDYTTERGWSGISPVQPMVKFAHGAMERALAQFKRELEGRK